MVLEIVPDVRLLKVLCRVFFVTETAIPNLVVVLSFLTGLHNIVLGT